MARGDCNNSVYLRMFLSEHKFTICNLFPRPGVVARFGLGMTAVDCTLVYPRRKFHGH
jgi:hypothetical protein